MSRTLGTAGQQLLGREPAKALHAIRALRRELDYVEEAQVANALSQGWTWAQIGRALGVSRQAAHHKYSHCRPAAIRQPRIALSPPARFAVMLARTEASARGDVLVGTEHLLLGILQQGDGEAAQVLRDAGLGLRALRSALDVLAPSDVCSIGSARIGFSARATRALERAALRARADSGQRISDLHLLDALLELPSSGAVSVIRALGIDEHRLRAAILSR